MREYEIMYILNPAEENVIEANIEKYNKIIVDNGGELKNLTKMGNRKLAYEIDKKNDGFYVLARFMGDSKVADELNRVMKISEEVIRNLIVRVEE
ncbi:MAG: 30S ribosomal protein S6 [Eubacteriales bacterium]|nr:30S ribosomal protein S6 [Eubacteriales bacterium]NCC81654.1 30S ribosomal protein S6 [Clostridia bacterium]